MFRILWILLACVCSSSALAPERNAVFVRVVDVGAGLCCVVKMPGGHNLVYDAGNYEDGGRTAFAAVQQLIPRGESIDLLVLSHTDSDHVAATKAICDAYAVKNIIHPGIERTTATWRRARTAIDAEGRTGQCEVFNLNRVAMTPGTSFNFGGVKAMIVCGFARPPRNWDIRDESERNNAGSIILRLTYRGHSILFGGDSVGRHIGDPNDACIGAEKFMIDNQRRVPIGSDVLVAPHHGADNGSSNAFIRAVGPKHVIFSAGHKFQHPRKTTAERFLAAGVDASRMFRTDRGDDEGAKEWSGQRVRRQVDSRGDDDVDVLIRRSGRVVVEYARP